MTDEQVQEMWDERIRGVAEHVQQASEAGAVMIAVFDGPWMTEGRTSQMGIVGGATADIFRIVRELRAIADLLEQQTAKIVARESFELTGELAEPARD